MLIIGELINGMYAGVRRAIRQKDKAAIQKSVFQQVQNGASALDVNCGPASADPVADMRWLIETIRQVSDIPLCLDSSKLEVIRAGLEISGPGSIINSITADTDKIDALIPLAVKYRAKVIALAMSSQGVPDTKEQRMELAAEIINQCCLRGFGTQELYLDPVVLPVNVAQAQADEAVEAIRDFKILSDPAPRTVIGLSNISQGARLRGLVNRVYLVMALCAGLDAAILDPTDSDLVDSLITAELLLNRQIYCDSYLEAYRKR